jgi:hypothetical protein
MECHPLVFRTRNRHKKNIAEQIELALADMVRDRYRAQEAYKREYDKYPTVAHYSEMWKDAILGLSKKNPICIHRVSMITGN